MIDIIHDLLSPLCHQGPVRKVLGFTGMTVEKLAWPEDRLDGAWFAVFTLCIDYLYPTETCTQARDHISCWAESLTQPPPSGRFLFDSGE